MARPKNKPNPDLPQTGTVNFITLDFSEIEICAERELSWACKEKIRKACLAYQSNNKDENDNDVHINFWNLDRLTALETEIESFKQKFVRIVGDLKLNVFTERLSELKMQSQYLITDTDIIGKSDWDILANSIYCALTADDVVIALTQGAQISKGARLVQYIMEEYARTPSRNSDNAFVKALNRAINN